MVMWYLWRVYTTQSCRKMEMWYLWTVYITQSCCEMVMWYQWTVYITQSCCKMVMWYQWRVYITQSCCNMVMWYQWKCARIRNSGIPQLQWNGGLFTAKMVSEDRVSLVGFISMATETEQFTGKRSKVRQSLVRWVHLHWNRKRVYRKEVSKVRWSLERWVHLHVNRKEQFTGKRSKIRSSLVGVHLHGNRKSNLQERGLKLAGLLWDGFISVETETNQFTGKSKVRSLLGWNSSPWKEESSWRQRGVKEARSIRQAADHQECHCGLESGHTTSTT